jgi:hypothetical protein
MALLVRWRRKILLVGVGVFFVLAVQGALNSHWQWNWYEVAEGAVTSLIFILAPVLWRMEKHHKEHVAVAEEHHAELLGHAKHQTMLAEETHYAAHHAGKVHPRVQARLDRGEARTPTLEET